MRSVQLVLLFVASIILVLVCVNALGAFVWGLIMPGMGLPDHFIATNSAVVLLYVLGGSWLEWQRLSEGGSSVALRLGGNALNEYNPRHRQLMNIAEELAIAAGIPVPELFVIEHDSMNALVAGHDPAHCALIVTRGALEHLSRLELQGVVAHEYAHIVNGDMALNTRLAGALYGLQSLSLLGHAMLRSIFNIRSRDRAPVLAPWPMMLMGGVVLSVVGSIGTLAARLVQAGVSRQREFLADAHAVEFVRDVDGLGRALRKIDGHPHTPMRSEYNEVIAHLWVNSNDPASRRWLDTHPPLATRVRRLYGHALPAIRPMREEMAGEAGAAPPVIETIAWPSAGEAPMAGLAAPGLQHDSSAATTRREPAVSAGSGIRQAEHPADRSAADVAIRPGTLQRDDQALTAAAMSALDRARDGSADGAPEATVLIAAARNPAYNLSKVALLLNAIVAGPGVLLADDQCEINELHHALQWLENPRAQWLRVPLIEILAARVRHWPLECRQTLVRYCHDAVLADGRIEKTEWIYFTLVKHRLLLDAQTDRRHTSAIDKRRALAEIFSMAGHLSDQSARRVRDAVVEAAAAIGVEQPAATPDGFEFRSLTRALDVLRDVSPLRKPILLKSLRDLAREDASPVYDAFLMAVAAAIDCPPLRRHGNTVLAPAD